MSKRLLIAIAGVFLAGIIVAQEKQNTRIPLIEEFSSSTCPPCKTFNETIFTPFLTNTANQGKFTCVNYRANWPGNGDPYYTAEAQTRITYYSVTGVPTCKIDATNANTSSASGFNTSFTTAAAKAAKVSITAIHQITGETPASGNVAVAITVTSTQDISNGLLYIALCEKKTTKNASTNGEKEFHHVMMKMAPNASGKSITLKANTPVTTTETASLSGTHIEEMSDLEVAVWVQVSGTKEVLNSAISVVGTTDISNTNLLSQNTAVSVSFNSQLKCIIVKEAKDAAICLYEISGKKIRSYMSSKTEMKIDTKSIHAGCYLLKLKRGNIIKACRLNISE